jgi:hypothetical protein
MQYSSARPDGMTITFAVETLPQAFTHIPDPRRAQGTRYSLAALLSLAVVAVLSNHTSTLAIAEWTSRQTRDVRQALGLKRDSTPHQTTLQRLFARLDPAAVAQAVQRVFDPVTPGEMPERGSQGVALDGKAQRGRLRHGATSSHSIHAVSAFCHDLGVILAQLIVDARQHQAELTIAPLAIRQIDWQGRVLTGDALYCQQALCQQVVEAGGDELLIVKENQPSLLADIVQVFEPLSTEERSRTCSEKGVSKQQVRYGITSLPASVSDAALLAALKRGH